MFDRKQARGQDVEARGGSSGNEHEAEGRALEFLKKGVRIPGGRITRDEVYCADEAFFTGTAAEVTPIRELDNRVIGEGTRGPITTKLQTAFFDVVKGKDPAYRHWLQPVNA